MSRVERADFSKLTGVKRTPQGGLRVPARLTRAGVFTYRRSDGSTVRELRPPEEVFKADSLATLSGAPVTELHPSVPVTAMNWSTLTKGHVGEDVRQDGKFVAANIFVQDSSVVAKVESKDLQELSCGYTCEIDPTPGVYEGERYDQIQRAIEYNHTALGPSGWGRAGSEVSLRMDSADGAIQVLGEESPSKPQNNKDRIMPKYRIDGVDYDTSTPEFLQALTQQEERQKARIDSLTSERDQLQGKLDGTTKELSNTKAKLDEATSQERVDSLVAERLEFITKARRVMGDDYNADGKAKKDIMVDCIRRDDKDFVSDGKSDGYIEGVFETLVKLGSSSSDGGTGITAVRSSAHDATRSRNDGSDVSPAVKARQDMLERQKKAAEAPLRCSTQTTT